MKCLISGNDKGVNTVVFNNLIVGKNTGAIFAIHNTYLNIVYRATI
jgi:hypothetical protein